MKHKKVEEVVVLGGFCQDCKSFKNKPGTCSHKHTFMARKMKPCEAFKKR